MFLLASLSLGGSPYRGVLLLEVCVFILGQVNQASAENGVNTMGSSRRAQRCEATFQPNCPEGPGRGCLQAQLVWLLGPLGQIGSQTMLAE